MIKKAPIDPETFALCAQAVEQTPQEQRAHWMQGFISIAGAF